MGDTVVASGYITLHDCAQFSWVPARCRCARALGAGRFCASRHHAHAADTTCVRRSFMHGVPCGMRQVLRAWHSMWNASEISGLEKDPEQTTWKWYLILQHMYVSPT